VQATKQAGLVIVCAGVVLLFAVSAWVDFRLRVGGRKGPAVVYADGVRYVACGGVIWLGHQPSPEDRATGSYEVLFTDPQGKKHNLKMVRMLTTTNLPKGSAVCAATPAAGR
jgi:hypothetical protein